MRYFILSTAIFLLAVSGAGAQFLPATEQPDQKIIRNSGGKSTSHLIRNAPTGDDFVMGNKDAPLVMVEYVSMTCPHCAHFTTTVLPELEKKYIKTGKMAYVLRQFPLNEPALKANMLLDCIGSQNQEKYYVFARVLFESQDKWAFDKNYVGSLETIAGVGGISKEQFKRCITDLDREVRIIKMQKTAREELQIPHTPYIFIGGEVYSGDHSVKSVSAFIDEKLAQVKK